MLKELKELYKEDPKDFMKEAVSCTAFFAVLIGLLYVVCWMDQYVIY